MIARVLEHGAVWYCAVDGEPNEDDDRFCFYCKSERGDWLCPDDGHRNPKGADECEECGRARPEDDE